MITRTYVAPGSDTSREAAIRMAPYAGPQALTIYAFIAGRDPQIGCTQIEASVTLGIARPSCCARFKALEDGGFIRKTRMRRLGACAYVVCGEAPQQVGLF